MKAVYPMQGYLTPIGVPRGLTWLSEGTPGVQPGN